MVADLMIAYQDGSGYTELFGVVESILIILHGKPMNNKLSVLIKSQLSLFG